MAKILVVDDEPMIRQLVRVLLEGEGHLVEEAQDGVNALAKTESLRPDLMMLDVMMPEMDGYMTLRQLRAKGLRKGLKVILLTAKSAEADFVAGWSLGVTEYVTKPFDPDALAKVVDATLRMSEEEIVERRRAELEKANLLSRIETAFGEG